jgi:hypothetical protein
MERRRCVYCEVETAFFSCNSNTFMRLRVKKSLYMAFKYRDEGAAHEMDSLKFY